LDVANQVDIRGAFVGKPPDEITNGDVDKAIRLRKLLAQSALPCAWGPLVGGQLSGALPCMEILASHGLPRTKIRFMFLATEDGCDVKTQDGRTNSGE